MTMPPDLKNVLQALTMHEQQVSLETCSVHANSARRASQYFPLRLIKRNIRALKLKKDDTKGTVVINICTADSPDVLSPKIACEIVYHMV